MRQFYLFLLLAFISLNANAQLTYVPDDNFEQALINLGYDSGILNDYVPTINISGVSILNVDDFNAVHFCGRCSFHYLINNYI